MEEAAELANYLPLSLILELGVSLTIDLLEPVALLEAIASVH